MYDINGYYAEVEEKLGWIISYKRDDIFWKIPDDWDIIVSREEFIGYLSEVLNGKIYYKDDVVGFYDIHTEFFKWVVPDRYEFYIDICDDSGNKIGHIDFRIYDGEFDIIAINKKIRIYIESVLEELKEKIKEDYVDAFNFIFGKKEDYIYE